MVANNQAIKVISGYVGNWLGLGVRRIRKITGYISD